jgi:hypothetical protein
MEIRKKITRRKTRTTVGIRDFNNQREQWQSSLLEFRILGANTRIS